MPQFCPFYYKLINGLMVLFVLYLVGGPVFVLAFTREFAIWLYMQIHYSVLGLFASSIFLFIFITEPNIPSTFQLFRWIMFIEVFIQIIIIVFVDLYLIPRSKRDFYFFAGFAFALPYGIIFFILFLLFIMRKISQSTRRVEQATSNQQQLTFYVVQPDGRRVVGIIV